MRTEAQTMLMFRSQMEEELVAWPGVNRESGVTETYLIKLISTTVIITCSMSVLPNSIVIRHMWLLKT